MMARLMILGMAALIVLPAASQAEDAKSTAQWDVAAAPASGGSASREHSRWSISGGFGFTASPEAFLLGFETDYALDENVSIGMLLELGVDSGYVMVSPQAYLRWGTRLSRFDSVGEDGLGKLRPYLQGGMGLTYLNIDLPPGFDEGDTGFLMSFGGGVEYPLSERVSIGSRMLLNFLPVQPFGEKFYYSWEVATVRYQF